MDNAILALQESGELNKLKEKWWVDEDNEGNCKVRTYYIIFIRNNMDTRHLINYLFYGSNMVYMVGACLINKFIKIF